jgi:hypothetical protein
MKILTIEVHYFHTSHLCLCPEFEFRLLDACNNIFKLSSQNLSFLAEVMHLIFSESTQK